VVTESAENAVSVVDITGAPDTVELVREPGGPPFFKAEGLPAGNKSIAWGSAWKTSEQEKKPAKMLFSRDYKGEIWEMQGLDIATKTAKFDKYLELAEGAGWHDGFTCLEKIVNISEEKEVMPMR